MRGQEKTVKSLLLTGTIYLKYEDEEQIATAQKGDITLYLNTDTSDRVPLKGNYYAKGYVGYFKADIFDGKEWQVLNITDFLEDKEHHFSKSECAIDTYHLIREMLEGHAGTEVYKGYRGGHYTTYLHVSQPYQGKRGA
jgi:hypothetical protein